VVGRPYTTAGGKNANVRVQRVDKPGVTEARMWEHSAKMSEAAWEALKTAGVNG
jgi:hypothetical protein